MLYDSLLSYQKSRIQVISAILKMNNLDLAPLKEAESKIQRSHGRVPALKLKQTLRPFPDIPDI